MFFQLKACNTRAGTNGPPVDKMQAGVGHVCYKDQAVSPNTRKFNNFLHTLAQRFDMLLATTFGASSLRMNAKTMAGIILCIIMHNYIISNDYVRLY